MYVCSGVAGVPGQDGQPFSGTFTSPNGVYSISVTDAGIVLRQHGHDVVKVVGSDLNLRADDHATLEAGAVDPSKSGKRN